MDTRKKKRLLKSCLKLSPYIVVFSMCSGYLLNDFISDKKENEAIEELKDDIVLKQEEEQEEIEEKVIEENTQEIIEPILEESEEISSELLESGYEFSEIDFETLKSINQDSSAWLTIDGTNIDLPVVKASDNEYYLHHDIEGNESRSGTLFTDYRNNSLESDELDDITFIYGHHMKGGKMLAQICNYKDQDFYNEHKFGIVYTPDGYAYKASVVATVVVPGDDENIISQSNFETTADFVKYMMNIKENNKIECSEKIDYSSKYLALVTCSYETTNSRCIVFLKLEKQYTKESQLDNNVVYTLK